MLTRKNQFKNKGTGPISFYFGMDFTRHEDNTLCLSPTKCIEKVLKNYERMFGEPTKHNVTLPLESGDHTAYRD